MIYCIGPRFFNCIRHTVRIRLGIRLDPHHRFALGLVHFRVWLDIMQMLSDAVNRVTRQAINELCAVDSEIIFGFWL